MGGGYEWPTFLSRWISYDIDSEGYDTDGTILMDPISDSPADAAEELELSDLADVTVYENQSESLRRAHTEEAHGTFTKEEVLRVPM